MLESAKPHLDGLLESLLDLRNTHSNLSPNEISEKVQVITARYTQLVLSLSNENLHDHVVFPFSNTDPNTPEWLKTKLLDSLVEYETGAENRAKERSVKSTESHGSPFYETDDIFDFQNAESQVTSLMWGINQPSTETEPEVTEQVKISAALQSQALHHDLKVNEAFDIFKEYSKKYEKILYQPYNAYTDFVDPPETGVNSSPKPSISECSVVENLVTSKKYRSPVSILVQNENQNSISSDKEESNSNIMLSDGSEQMENDIENSYLFDIDDQNKNENMDIVENLINMNHPDNDFAELMVNFEESTAESGVNEEVKKEKKSENPISIESSSKVIEIESSSDDLEINTIKHSQNENSYLSESNATENEEYSVSEIISDSETDTSSDEEQQKISEKDKKQIKENEELSFWTPPISEWKKECLKRFSVDFIRKKMSLEHFSQKHEMSSILVAAVRYMHSGPSDGK